MGDFVVVESELGGGSKDGWTDGWAAVLDLHMIVSERSSFSSACVRAIDATLSSALCGSVSLFHCLSSHLLLSLGYTLVCAVYFYLSSSLLSILCSLLDIIFFGTSWTDLYTKAGAKWRIRLSAVSPTTLVSKLHIRPVLVQLGPFQESYTKNVSLAYLY